VVECPAKVIGRIELLNNNGIILNKLAEPSPFKPEINLGLRQAFLQACVFDLQPPQCSNASAPASSPTVVEFSMIVDACPVEGLLYQFFLRRQKSVGCHNLRHSRNLRVA
jgi:hypothetical protein